jgi:ERF superfamily.
VSKHDITIRPATAAENYSDDALMQVLAAVTRGDMPIDTMERLVALSERMMEQKRRQAFFAALARLTPKLPEIQKHGTSHHGKYARLEDIDRAIRPLIAEEGFAISFDTQSAEGGKVRVIGRLSHSEGHSEIKQIDLPLDNSGSKNGAQAVISTVAYGRRALTKMFFNLIEAGEDIDGNDPTNITDEQVKDLETLATEVKANKASLFEILGVKEWKEILARDYDKAVRALEMKRRVQR